MTNVPVKNDLKLIGLNPAPTGCRFLVKANKMNYILSRFFYAIGLMMLLCILILDGTTAEFKDFVVILQSPRFWNISMIVMVIIMGLDLIFSPGFHRVFDQVTDKASRLKIFRNSKIS